MMKKPDKSGGYTLTEMMLVLGILGILFAIATNTYSSQRQKFEFEDSLSRVITLIKTARDYAVTSRPYYDKASDKSIVPPEGYGVYIDRASKQLILFANTAPADIDSLKTIKINTYDAPGDVIEEQYTLPGTAVFEALINGVKQTTTPDNTVPKAVIIFRPPLADTFISNNGDPAVPANLIDTLTMKLFFAGSPNVETAKRYITINKTAGFPELIVPKP